MTPVIYARKRLDAVLREIARLKEADFPYSHSLEALEHIESVFNSRLAKLQAVSPENDSDVVRTLCSEALVQIFGLHPFLGFVLRSTNVRNSFEVFGPLLRLARSVLGGDTKLILSSEWMYSPHIFNVPSLPNFVLLGLPACESDNPLLIPLAGHEFGHTAWLNQRFESKFTGSVQSRLLKFAEAQKDEYEEHFGEISSDLMAATNLRPAYEYALRQMEETFCDNLGLLIFSESFLHAFAYLLAPGTGHRSTPYYPTTDDRIANLVRRAATISVSVPDGYENLFAADVPISASPKDMFLIKLADLVRSDFSDELFTLAEKIVKDSSYVQRDSETIDRVLQSLRLTTPCPNSASLANILNAGWIVYHDCEFWHAEIEQKDDLLRELLLKSVEINEYEHRIAEAK
ncbi:MAG: hypothetical protein WBD20_10700 [Pirellulaceae bacterium]